MSPQSDATPGSSSRRTLILGGVAVGMAVVGWNIWRRIPPDFEGTALTPAKAHSAALAGDILLVDIRTPREWRATGVPEGATPLDMRRADFDTALADLVGGDTSRPIALICARGVRSARLANRLARAGFRTIIDVPEGMLGSATGPGWIRAGLPVLRETGETG